MDSSIQTFTHPWASSLAHIQGHEILNQVLIAGGSEGGKGWEGGLGGYWQVEISSPVDLNTLFKGSVSRLLGQANGCGGLVGAQPPRQQPSDHQLENKAMKASWILWYFQCFSLEEWLMMK